MLTLVKPYTLQESDAAAPHTCCRLSPVGAASGPGVQSNRASCLQLVQELGQKAMLGKEAPAKRLLFNVNKRPELIERRRKELQQWLWRLISDPDVAKAKNLNDFLELSDAARLVQR